MTNSTRPVMSVSGGTAEPAAGDHTELFVLLSPGVSACYLDYLFNLFQTCSHLAIDQLFYILCRRFVFVQVCLSCISVFRSCLAAFH